MLLRGILAQQISIEKHGGSIEVDSQLEQGAEFIIKIPIQ
jgi:signal transduction histidine kinase